MRQLIRMSNIDKHFGGVHALRDVSIDVSPSEVVALLGHNGAGKSVLVQILSGVFAASDGEIFVDDKPVGFRSPLDARAANIETIYQNLALAENLNAAENFFLGRELTSAFGFLDHRKMAEIAKREIQNLNPNFQNIKTQVVNLSGGQRQAIAIARAVYFDARLLIMDEPTAALGPHETKQVVNMIEHLKDQGLGILLVSHDLNDVFALADRIVVLKNGRLVASNKCSDVSQDEVLEMMATGQPVGQPKKPTSDLVHDEK